MAADVIRSFLGDLVTAISENVLSVSDQCLVRGLITESTYKKVLELGGTSEDRARTLILAVKNCTETDSRCLDILLSILDQKLPHASREKLMSEIRKEVTEKVNTCTAVVPSSQAIQQLPPGELAKESALQESSLLGRFEDSIRQHERACAEKNLLEERLKVKSEKYKRLKEKLESLRVQNQEAANTQSRISACTIQIENLKKRIEELQKTIEEQGMQAKRGRNTVITQTKKLFDSLVQQSQQKIEKREKEALAARKAEDEIRLVVHEKDLKIRELQLEVESMQRKEASESVVVPTDIIKPHYIDTLYRSIEDNDPEYDCISHWKMVGAQLGLSDKELGNIPLSKQIVHFSRPSEKCFFARQCLSLMLKEWVKWYPGDSRGSTKFPTYSDLQKVLIKAGFGNIARDLISYSELESTATITKNSKVLHYSRAN